MNPPSFQNVGEISEEIWISKLLVYQNIFKIDDNFKISDAEVLQPGHSEGDCQHVHPHHDQHNLQLQRIYIFI